MHIGFDRDDIGQGMNILPIEPVDVITEPLENGQYGSGIVKLGPSRREFLVISSVSTCGHAP